MYVLDRKYDGMYTGTTTNKKIKEYCKSVSVSSFWQKERPTCLNITVETDKDVIKMQTTGVMTLGEIVGQLCKAIKREM
ncbi:hypothetical protein SAMN04487864_11549 [Succiniclasticum ruminis]|uniref:Uncharacterized protein n=1 Tax=Succiniclasticum ruminis TaxID=40841 RepID=A0A1G6NS05_9FIRM|nr:hypothetical protein [Succiniclasticum ruminis]SDC70086.1 hypothetical protein SAMN04487864_11549 [Succiniclasticum ruminis]